MSQLRTWVKAQDNGLSRAFYNTYFWAREIEIPAPARIFKWVDLLYTTLKNLIENSLRVMFYTPMFKSRCEHVGKKMYLYGGIPFTSGPLSMCFSDRCRISGKTTITARSTGAQKKQLCVGRNTDIGWQTTIAVGSRVILEDNVRIAGQCFLAGYPGHPMNPVARAQGLPEEDYQVGDIVLEKDVWIATGVTILAGVRIAQGSIIGAGSVVTKDIPAGVIAAGVPARIVGKISPNGCGAINTNVSTNSKKKGEC